MSEAINKMFQQSMEGRERKTPKQRKQQRTAQLIDETSQLAGVVAPVATNTGNTAEEIAGKGTIGEVFTAALAKQKGVDHTDTPEAVGPQGFKAKTTKKKPDPHRVIETKTIIVEGQEVACKVLAPGREYYVGKSIPSGKPPHGTNRKEEEDPEVKVTQRTANYLGKQLDSADQFEERHHGEVRKNGIAAADIDVALDQLHEEAKTQGIELEEIE